MVTKKFYFSFFLSLLIMIFGISFVSACSYTLPCQGGGEWCLCGFEDDINFTGFIVPLESPIDYHLDYGEYKLFSLNYNFYGYDWINLSVNGSGSAYVTLEGISRSCVYTAEITYCLIPSYSAGVPYVAMTYESVTNTGSRNDLINLVGGEEHVEVINATYNETWQSATNFEYYVSVGNTGVQQDVDTLIDYDGGDGWFTSWAASLASLFPDAKTLGATGKFAMILVTFIFTAFIIYFLAYFGGGEKLTKFAHWIVISLYGLWFMFFVSISYIPLSVLIVVMIIVILFGVRVSLSYAKKD